MFPKKWRKNIIPVIYVSISAVCVTLADDLKPGTYKNVIRIFNANFKLRISVHTTKIGTVAALNSRCCPAVFVDM